MIFFLSLLVNTALAFFADDREELARPNFSLTANFLQACLAQAADDVVDGEASGDGPGLESEPRLERIRSGDV